MHDYASHEQKVLSNMGVVDAGLQYGKLGVWHSGELTADKWVAVEYPLDHALNKNGNTEAAFVYIYFSLMTML